MSETKDQTIARHDQHTAWKDGIDTIECDTDCRACTIARLTQEVLDAKSNTAAFCGEVVTLRAELAASREIGPCGKHPKMFWNRGRAPSAGSPLPEIEPYCTICAELAASRAECYERAAETAHTYYLHLSNNGHSFLEHGVASDIRDDIRALITTSDAAAREDWIRRIRLEEAKDIRREQNLRIAKSFMDWLDDHIIELKTTAATENREQRAERFKRESGKKVHASDCATSVAPAEEPGPCDCDETCTDAAAREEWTRRVRLEGKQEVIDALKSSEVLSWQDAGRFLQKLVDGLRAPVPAARAGDVVCPTCKGSQLSGKFDVDGNERPCPDCDGTGKRESK